MDNQEADKGAEAEGSPRDQGMQDFTVLATPEGSVVSITAAFRDAGLRFAGSAASDGGDAAGQDESKHPCLGPDVLEARGLCWVGKYWLRPGKVGSCLWSNRE